jgi:hypothetical protein
LSSANQPTGRLGVVSGRTASASRTSPTRPASRRDERWLSAIWERQAFDRRGLRTTAGLRFKVVFPGLCTGGAGPDFRDAILALADGSLLRGDVELHLESSGWREHGHDRDPAYERVLLHVVLEDDEPAVNSAGERVLTVELAGRLGPVRSREPAYALRETEAPAAQLSYVVAPCRRTVPQAGPDALRSALSGLALDRFRAKQSVFEGELAVFDPEQALYAGIMQALGYSRNREPFRQLAQLVPLAGLACAGSAARIEELLLAGAGLAFAPSSLLIEAGLTGETLPAGAWTAVGVRPDNLPRRRIAQFAAILERMGRGGLLEELLGPLMDGAEEAWRAGLRDRLSELGTQRIDAIAINVLLPFAAAYGQATCRFLLAERAAQAFLGYPAEGGNQVTRYMRREVLGGLAGVASGAAGEQALLHVWDRWCHEKVCALCPLGTSYADGGPRRSRPAGSRARATEAGLPPPTSLGLPSQPA